MRHAVILAHPDRESFDAFVARTYMDTVGSLGHTASLRDLYALGFDPRLTAAELPWRKDIETPAAVRAERAVVAQADVLALIYPLWFNAPPAMMKGYVERVLGVGFAFARGFAGTRPLLAGKRLITVSTTGELDEWTGQAGAVARLRSIFDDHLASVCGFAVVDHLHLGPTPGVRMETAENMLRATETSVRRLFGPAAHARATGRIPIPTETSGKCPTPP